MATDGCREAWHYVSQKQLHSFHRNQFLPWYWETHSGQSIQLQTLRCLLYVCASQAEEIFKIGSWMVNTAVCVIKIHVEFLQIFTAVLRFILCSFHVKRKQCMLKLLIIKFWLFQMLQVLSNALKQQWSLVHCGVEYAQEKFILIIYHVKIIKHTQPTFLTQYIKGKCAKAIEENTIVSMAAENWDIGGTHLNNNKRNNKEKEKDSMGRFPLGCRYLCLAKLCTALLEGFYC